jgi:hypothetical protein
MPGPLVLIGAGAFGVLIGWYVYYVNRYRKGDVQLSDITTLIGVIGGGSILTLFEGAKTEMFGAYGVGLFVGFFAYLILLSVMVSVSPNFSIDFFLDGRRKKLADDEMIPAEVQQTVRPMSLSERVSELEQVAERTAARRMMSATDAPFTAAAWKPTPAAQRVIDSCEASWNDDTKADCNKYAKQVLLQFGLSDFGPGDDANAIAAKLANDTWCAANKWTRLADGAAAKAQADAGKLVVGAISGPNYVPPVNHGHVVVAVSSEKLHAGKYPFAYWGKLNSVGEKNTQVTRAFNAASVDKVVYATKTV